MSGERATKIHWIGSCVAATHNRRTWGQYPVGPGRWVVNFALRSLSCAGVRWRGRWVAATLTRLGSSAQESCKRKLSSACCILAPSSSYTSALKVETTCSSKTSVNFCQTIRRHIPGYSIFHSLRCEDPRCNVQRWHTFKRKKLVFFFSLEVIEDTLPIWPRAWPSHTGHGT
jgi:hypothetical protein